MADFTPSNLDELLQSRDSISDNCIMAIENEVDILSNNQVSEFTRSNSFAVVRVLLQACIQETGIEIVLRQKVIRLLGLLGSIYSSLWVDFMSSESSAVFVVTSSATNNLIMILEETLHSIQKHRSDDKLKPREVYMGYDKRDMADYNSEGYERNHEDDPLSEEERNLLAEKEALAIDGKTLLLILQQMYGQRSDALSDAINNNIEYTSSTIVTKLSNNVETLLHLAKGLEEESFMQIINIVSLINGHFIPSILDNQTEISRVFACVESSEDYGVNISQGLLHIINEHGYPSVRQFETLAVVKFCTDLIYTDTPSSPSSSSSSSSDILDVSGHFYTNDIKILVEIITRELSNIPFVGRAASSDSVEFAEYRY
eukprot:gene30458-39703_t